jgi:negative regulator of genetic competence, sporulation and motility
MQSPMGSDFVTSGEGENHVDNPSRKISNDNLRNHIDDDDSSTYSTNSSSNNHSVSHSKSKSCVERNIESTLIDPNNQNNNNNQNQNQNNNNNKDQNNNNNHNQNQNQNHNRKDKAVRNIIENTTVNTTVNYSSNVKTRYNNQNNNIPIRNIPTRNIPKNIPREEAENIPARLFFPNIENPSRRSSSATSPPKKGKEREKEKEKEKEMKNKITTENNVENKKGTDYLVSCLRFGSTFCGVIWYYIIEYITL